MRSDWNVMALSPHSRRIVGHVTEGKVRLKVLAVFYKNYICSGSSNTSTFIVSLAIVKSCVTTSQFHGWQTFRLMHFPWFSALALKP